MKITLVPTAGLCNRLNAITSGILYQKYHKDAQLYIYWEKSKECYAHFTDLFEPLDCIEIKPLRKFYLKPGRKKNLYIPDILKKIYFDAYYNGNTINRNNFEKLTTGKQNIYVTSYNPFTPYEITSSLATFFKPTQELKERISLITEQYEDNVVGVHIRRTDNLASIKNNPIEKFYSLIDREITINSNCRFYLSSDEESVKKDMTKRYGDRIIFSQLPLVRDDVEGMKGAVVDLYCLGATKKIIGCTNSTFSNTASRLYDIELIV